MKRPGYREAIAWIASNDDTSCLDDDGAPGSVTMALIADLFGKSDEVVAKDIRKVIAKAERKS